MNALAPRDKEPAALFPPVTTDTPDQARLRSALNSHSAAMLKAIDGSLRLRTAPAEAQRLRHIASNYLRDAGLNALHAYSLTKPEA